MLTVLGVRVQQSPEKVLDLLELTFSGLCGLAAAVFCKLDGKFSEGKQDAFLVLFLATV